MNTPFFTETERLSAAEGQNWANVWQNRLSKPRENQKNARHATAVHTAEKARKHKKSNRKKKFSWIFSFLRQKNLQPTVTYVHVSALVLRLKKDPDILN